MPGLQGSRLKPGLALEVDLVYLEGSPMALRQGMQHKSRPGNKGAKIVHRGNENQPLHLI
jgi:hypothetical protein